MGKHYVQDSGRSSGRKSRGKIRKLTGIILAACVVAAVGTGSFVTVMAQDTPLVSSIQDGSKLYTVTSKTTDVDMLLEQAGVTLGDNDIVVSEQNNDSLTLTVRRQISVDINNGDETVTVNGYTGDTVDQLIKEAGIELSEHDTVTPSKATQIWEDASIDIDEKNEVYIVDNKIVKSYLVPECTAAEAVEYAGIRLGDEDTVVGGRQDVKDGMVIHINRVTYAEFDKTKSVDYEVTEQESEDLLEGETEVQTEGQKGEKVVTYQQKLVNGEVVKTSKISETVTIEPTDEVILIGTKVEEEEPEEEPEEIQEDTAAEETEPEETESEPEETESEPEEAEEPEQREETTPSYSGKVLSPSTGTVNGPSGKETYYNLDMSGVVDLMHSQGFEGEYWVRSDGCKMFGNYIIVAANLNVHPRGSTVATSLGTGIVCDTGGFAYSNPNQLDIATNW